MGISVRLNKAQFQGAVNANSDSTVLTLSSGLLKEMGLQGNTAASNVFIRGQLLQILHESLSERTNEQLVKTFLENAEKTLYGPLIDQPNGKKQYGTETASQGLTVATVKTLLADLNLLKQKDSTPKFTFESLVKFANSKSTSNVGEVCLDKKGQLKLVNIGNERKVVTTPVQNAIVRMQVCERMLEHVDPQFKDAAADCVKRLLISKEIVNLPLSKPELKSMLAYLESFGRPIHEGGRTDKQVDAHIFRLQYFNLRRFGQTEGEVTTRIENNIKSMYGEESLVKCKEKYGKQFDVLTTQMYTQYRDALDPLIRIGNQAVSDKQLTEALKEVIRNIAKLKAGGWNDIRKILDEHWMTENNISTNDKDNFEKASQKFKEGDFAAGNKILRDAGLWNLNLKRGAYMYDFSNNAKRLESVVCLEVFRDYPSLRSLFLTEPYSLTPSESATAASSHFSHKVVNDLNLHSEWQKDHVTWIGTWDTEDEAIAANQALETLQQAGMGIDLPE